MGVGKRKDIGGGMKKKEAEDEVEGSMVKEV